MDVNERLKEKLAGNKPDAERLTLKLFRALDVVHAGLDINRVKAAGRIVRAMYESVVETLVAEITDGPEREALIEALCSTICEVHNDIVLDPLWERR